MKNHTKIFWFMIFHIKLCLIQNYCLFDLMKREDLLEFIMRYYIYYRYLVLFDSEKYKAVYNRIKYLISQRSGISYVIPHNYAKIKVDFLLLFTSRKYIDFT